MAHTRFGVDKLVAPLGSTNTVCGAAHVSDVNTSEQADSDSKSCASELSIRTTTCVPGLGGAVSVTFKDATTLLRTASGHGEMEMS